MIFKVRARKVLIEEIEVEADCMKKAFELACEKLEHDDTCPRKLIGKRYEIETIKIGQNYEKNPSQIL